jgi:hypothetical protein
MESVVPEVAKAASVIRKEVPKPQAESAMSALTDEFASNWKPLLLGASAVVAAQVARSALAGRRTGGNTPPTNPPNTPQSGAGGTGTPATVTSPTTQGPLFATEAETVAHQAEVDRRAQADKRLADFEAMWSRRNAPAAAPVEPLAPPVAEAPVAVAPTAAAETTEDFLQRMEQKYGPLPTDGAPVDPTAPKTTAAIATEQPGSAVADAVVRDELVKPVAPSATPAEPSVAGRVRRTAAQISKDQAEAFANAPEGMRPAAPRKTNKLPGDVIGQGGWHFFTGQGGNPEDWLRLYGRTPQPYSRVVADIKGGVLPVPAPVEGKKGGAVPRGEFVPEYIKGQATIPGMVNAGLNALGALGLVQAFKEGQKTGDYSDFGLGAIGQVLGNVAPKAGVGFSLMTPGTLNANEEEELAKRRKKPVTLR